MGNKDSKPNEDDKNAIQHLEKYLSLQVFPKDVKKTESFILPELRKRNIYLKEITVSRVQRNLQFLFRKPFPIDVRNVHRLAFVYCVKLQILELPIFPSLRKITLLGTHLTNDTIFKYFEDSRDEIEDLDLRGNFFGEFPKRITDFVSLKRLNLMGLKLKEMPVFKFPHLVYLNISENEIREFGDEYLSGLENLSILLCYDNKIEKFLTEFPKELTQVNCSKNQISRIPQNLPESVTDFSCCYNQVSEVTVKNCKNLEKLYLAFNRIKSVDVEGCQSLYLLDVSDNGLENVVGLDSCKKLQEVYMGRNNLDSKFLEALMIGEERSLKFAKLCCGYNRIEKIPEKFFSKLSNLQFLDLSGNLFEEITNDIMNLSNKLITLYLMIGDNPNLKEFPLERITESLKYFNYWGTPASGIISKKLAEDEARRKMVNVLQEVHEVDNISVAFQSIKGPYRFSNEDAHADSVLCNGKARFLAVFDGHGGNITSQKCAKKLPSILDSQMKKFLENEKEEEIDWDVIISESIKLMLESLKKEKVEDGTTLIGVILYENEIICMNLGDSRAIAVRKDGSIIELSRDHKPTDLIEWSILKERKHVLVNSKVDGIIGVTRSLGDFKHDLYYATEIQKTNREKENIDFVVLACDGVFDVLSSNEVGEIVKNSLEKGIPENIVSAKLVNIALSCNSRDNISACICNFKEE